MVKAVYVCSICRFAYRSKLLAQKCEQFCRKYRGCSIQITRRSVGEVKL